MFYLLKVDLLNRQRSLMPAVSLMSLQMEIAGKEYKITRNRHLGKETPVLIWKRRTRVQLCISSEGRLTMEPSFPSLFATKRRVISFWLTGPEDQKTTGNLNVSLGHNHSPYHGNTSGNEAFGADQLRFRPRGRSKTCQDLEEWLKVARSIWLHRDKCCNFSL